MPLLKNRFYCDLFLVVLYVYKIKFKQSISPFLKGSELNNPPQKYDLFADN